MTGDGWGRVVLAMVAVVVLSALLGFGLAVVRAASGCAA